MQNSPGRRELIAPHTNRPRKPGSQSDCRSKRERGNIAQSLDQRIHRRKSHIHYIYEKLGTDFRACYPSANSFAKERGLNNIPVDEFGFL